MKVTEFDKSKEFETKAEPLLQELLKVCKFYEIPLFSTTINHQILQDDQIRKHLLVANGFDVIPPGTFVEMNCEDLLDDDMVSQEK